MTRSPWRTLAGGVAGWMLVFVATPARADWRSESGRLYREGRFVEALAVVEEHLREAPADAEARLLSGVLQMRLKRYGDAADRIERALREGAQGGRSEAWVFLGQARAHLGRYAESREAFEAALAEDPSEGRALVGIGYAWLREGDLAQAEPWLRRAVALDPPAPKAHLWLGDLLLQRSRASSSDERAGPDGPQRAEGVGEPAIVERAIAVLEEARRREPWSEEVAFKLSLAHRRAGDVEAARAERERFQRLREEAARIAAWEASLTTNPSDRGLLEALATAYEGRGQTVEALGTLHRLHALLPAEGEYALRMGRLYGALGRREEGIRVLEGWLADARAVPDDVRREADRLLASLRAEAAGAPDPDGRVPGPDEDSDSGGNR